MFDRHSVGQSFLNEHGIDLAGMHALVGRHGSRANYEASAID